jgi:hypothetical protein
MGFYIYDDKFKISIYCNSKEDIYILYPGKISTITFKSLKDRQKVNLNVTEEKKEYVSFTVRDKKHISINHHNSNFVICEPENYICPDDWKILTTLGYKEIENKDYTDYLFPYLNYYYEGDKSYKYLYTLIMILLFILLWQI